MRIRAAMLTCLFAGAVQADVRGEVYQVLNPEAPRAEWRRERVANAYVILAWRPTIPSGHSTPCIHAEIARTDGSGAYAMDGPAAGALGGIRPMVGVAVFAPGLEIAREPLAPHPDPKSILLAKYIGPAYGRVSQLSALADAGCMTRALTYVFEDPKGLRNEYFQALLAETRTLPASSSTAVLVGTLEERAGIPQPKMTVRAVSSPIRAQQVPQ
jgi:hypothetical protein